MKRAVQIRIYPTPKQVRAITEQLECHRLLYNTILDSSEKLWEEKKEKESDFDLITRWIKHFKNTDARFKICNYSSLQQTVRRFGKARKTMIQRRTKGLSCKMRFKGFDRFNSIEYTFGDGLTIKNDRVRIQGVGEIKTFWHRTPENPSCAILTRRADKYYVTFIQEYHNGAAPSTGEASIGIDFGIKTLATLSNGEKIESPKFAKRDKKDIARIHRQIHKAEKVSKLREKRKKALRKVHARISNRRKDFNHKLSRKLVNSYDIICAEDLEVKKILSFTPINRAIADLGIAQLKTFLSYKAENAGKKIVFVNPAYTTQACSACGKLSIKTLDERIHSCKCGYTEDRDINAAKNILALGLRELNLDSGATELAKL